MKQDFTDLDQMKKWLDKIQQDIAWPGKIWTATILDALIKYKEYFEVNVSVDDAQNLFHSRQINDLVLAYTQRLIGITLGDEPINMTAKQALKVLTEVEEEEEVGKVVDIERLQEIEKAKELFFKDSYSMSVGELLSFYEKKELVISTNSLYVPVTQQNDFIESIFLDLPAQPIFVRQEKDGKWRTLAGGWMLKAILHFLDGNKEDRLVLRATELLPCLYGLTWDDFSDRERCQFKRYRFQVHILAENTEDRYLKDKVQSIFWRYSSFL